MVRKSRRQVPQLNLLEDRAVPTFQSVVNYPIDTGPVEVVAGDFNADGTDDLVVPSFESNNVGVLLSNGDGTFQPARTSLAPAVISAAVGEFNGDGRMDLAISTLGEYPFFEANSVSIMLGNGDGTFQAPYRIALSGSPVVGDVNGDGNLDLAVAFLDFNSTGIVGVLLGNGDGSFRRGGDISTLGTPGEMQLGDLNGDGNLDLAAANQSGQGNVIVVLGNGDGSFGAPRHFLTGPVPNSLALADVNGDSRPDIATSNSPSNINSYRGTLSVLVNNGDGTFEVPSQYDVGPILSRPQLVFSGDFNGDETVDLGSLVTSVQPGSRNVVSVLLGRGNGTFQTSVMVDVNQGAQSAVAVDFNGDGLTDVATANGFFDATVSALINDGVWPTTDAPTITISDPTVIEGHAGTKVVTFAVTLSSAYGLPVGVDYSTDDYTATAGSDYESEAGLLTFAAGETSKTITVVIRGDRIGESNETFYVNLTSPSNAVLGEQRGAGHITDDEPRVSISNISLREKNSGVTLFVFTVTLSAPYDQAVTVNFATRDGTARAGEDYESTAGTLTFAPGETVKTITVRVRGDRQKEANESFLVDLSGASNALFARSWAYGLILDDDTR